MISNFTSGHIIMRNNSLNYGFRVSIMDTLVMNQTETL
jgi:hypothetical protein